MWDLNQEPSAQCGKKQQKTNKQVQTNKNNNNNNNINNNQIPAHTHTTTPTPSHTQKEEQKQNKQTNKAKTVLLGQIILLRMKNLFLLMTETSPVTNSIWNLYN